MADCNAKGVVNGYPQPKESYGIIQDDGNRKKADVIDTNSESLLYDILTELKIMNMHLSKLTDEQINTGDI